MTQRISSMEVRQRLGDLLDRVALRQDQFVIERKGKPLAALVPVHRLEQMQEAARLFLLETQAASRSRLSLRDAASLANEAKHRTRGRGSAR